MANAIAQRAEESSPKGRDRRFYARGIRPSTTKLDKDYIPNNLLPGRKLHFRLPKSYMNNSNFISSETAIQFEKNLRRSKIIRLLGWKTTDEDIKLIQDYILDELKVIIGSQWVLARSRKERYVTLIKNNIFCDEIKDKIANNLSIDPVKHPDFFSSLSRDLTSYLSTGLQWSMGSRWILYNSYNGIIMETDKYIPFKNTKV